MNYQAYLDFCREQECGDVEFTPPNSQDPEGPAPGMQGFVKKPLAQSNSVSSLVTGTGLHRPALDLDMGALLVQSSTPGHHHLYIDKQMPWGDYEKLLKVLAEVGIIQRGYADASIKRKRSRLRTPWTRKESS